MLAGGVVYAVSLFAVAHATVLGITLPALVGISFAFVAVSTSMTTLLQTDTDPRLRGRLLGIYATIFAGLQPLGTVAYGLLSHSGIGLFNAIGVGALLVGATTIIVVITPSFRARVSGLEMAAAAAGGQLPRYTGLRMFHGWRGVVAAVCLLFVTGCSSPPAGSAAKPSPVIARVAGETITLAQFNTRYNSALVSIEQGGGPKNNASQTTQLRETILGSLIIDTVIRQEATALGLEATAGGDPGAGCRRRDE